MKVELDSGCQYNRKAISVKNVVEKIDYKPGSWCSIRQTGNDIVIVEIHIPSWDLKTKQPAFISRSVWLSGFLNMFFPGKTKILKLIKNCLVELELHELDEWLVFENKKVRNPHPHAF
jgi:hypothetical protein